MIVFNLRQQLKPEQLEAARKLWETNGPKDYVLKYSIHVYQDQRTDHYLVRVKQGKAYEAIVNDLPQSADRMGYYGMEALFNYIERFLEIDAEPNAPRTFARARFDEKTGALRDYVRRVMGKSDRVEITVEGLEAHK